MTLEKSIYSLLEPDLVVEVGPLKVRNRLGLGRVYDKIVLYWQTQQGKGLVVSLDELAVVLDTKLF